ncbi:MAG: hypothetical protein HY860_01940 [Chlamydiales bacterium]|nr:hypothetical protein [Chlamydiales bacterium]
MEGKKQNKEGMTVQEIEGIAKKYRFELVFCLAFILAAAFSYLFSMEGWSVFLAAVGGIIGICLPKHIERFEEICFRFIYKQEKITQIIIGVVLLVLAVFISPLVFLLLGLMGGVEVYHSVAKNSMSS